MTTLKIQDSEKSLNQQVQSTYVFVADDINFSINKIELAKLFTKNGQKVESIRVVNPYIKNKVKGKKRTKVTQKRAKKFFVKFTKDQKIKEGFQLEIK